MLEDNSSIHEYWNFYFKKEIIKPIEILNAEWIEYEIYPMFFLQEIT